MSKSIISEEKTQRGIDEDLEFETESEADDEEDEDEDADPDYWCDEEDEDVYDEYGNTVYSPYMESLKVDRVCSHCRTHFRGMPDHGYCDRCADRRERGEDFEY